MAYQSAKQNRRSTAGNASLLSSGRKSFTHQVFSQNGPATQMDSINHETSMNQTRESGCECILETTMEQQSESTMSLRENFITANDLSNDSNQAGDLQFLLCKFFTALIETQEHLMKAKADFLDLRFDLEKRFMKQFSPVMLFQRIDRAGKGHITRSDVLRFLEENGFVEGHGYAKQDLKLIFRPAKTQYQRFVKLIIDTKLEHKGSMYFNERLQENDQVIRKIDTLPPRLEKAFCELMLLQINLKKELNFFREEIKSKRGFVLLDLFKAIVFENQQDPSKQIFVGDIMRFFRFNKLLIEQDRVEEILFKRVVGTDRPFDFSRLHKLLTKETLQSIVHNPAVQVNGLKSDCRRTIAHKKTMNAKTLSSLTGPQRLNPVQQCLRNRRACPAPECPHSMLKVQLTGPKQSCKLDDKTAHTKCFHTDYITDEELVVHLQTYLRDLLVLDNELEDTRIRLANERDFYPHVCFKAFIASDESKEQVRLNSKNEKSDGLTELTATTDSIYAFIRECSASVESLGMCSRADLDAFLVEFLRQRHQGVVPCEHMSAGQLKYADFLALISPKNRDFTELMHQRQTDYDIQLQENQYITGVLDKTQTGDYVRDTKCRLARPVFVEDEMHSNVASLLAETILKMVLTHQRNLEIVRTYEKSTKGKHETAHILRYVPQLDNQSTVIRTVDVLNFVQPEGVTSGQSAKVRKFSGSKHARGSSHHTCVKTQASTCDMVTRGDTINRDQTLQTPVATLSRRREFDLIKSHEKEALYLSERFGDNVTYSNSLNRSFLPETRKTSGAIAFGSGVDPGFAPEVLHLSKGKIDQSLKLR